MLIDDVRIKVRAGKGGNGIVHFNKNKMALGPTGGNGGRGGNVYAKGVSDIGALRQFRYVKEVCAENGRNGQGQLKDGRNGKDTTFVVPVGTVIHNLDTGTDVEVLTTNQKVLVARGGQGGRGNFLFRGPANTTPMEHEDGLPGEKFTIRLELKLIADIGFIGLPNVGKSSLLNELTRTNVKVANYPFTTLEPNLGVYYDLILADIPGLIEGAAYGKGLGIKFLRHIDRTKFLFHFVSAESSTPIKDYRTVRKELGLHNKNLLNKKEYLFISKSDMADKKTIQRTIAKFKRINPDVIPFSILEDESIISIRQLLNKIRQNK